MGDKVWRAIRLRKVQPVLLPSPHCSAGTRRSGLPGGPPCAVRFQDRFRTAPRRLQVDAERLERFADKEKRARNEDSAPSRAQRFSNGTKDAIRDRACRREGSRVR